MTQQNKSSYNVNKDNKDNKDTKDTTTKEKKG